MDIVINTSIITVCGIIAVLVWKNKILSARDESLASSSDLPVSPIGRWPLIGHVISLTEDYLIEFLLKSWKACGRSNFQAWALGK
jgi:hypothetical protein